MLRLGEAYFVLEEFLDEMQPVAEDVDPRLCAAYAMHLTRMAELPADLIPMDGGRAELSLRAHRAARLTPNPDEYAAQFDYIDGQWHKHHGRFGDAREVLRHALAEHTEARSMKPSVVLSMAEVESLELRWEPALEWIERAEALIEPENPRHSMNNLPGKACGLRGVILQALGLPDRAAGWFAAERRHAEKSGDPRVILGAVQHQLEVWLYGEREELVVEEIRRVRERMTALSEEEFARLALYDAVARAGLARRGEHDEQEAADRLRAAIASPLLPRAECARPGLMLAELELRAGRAPEAEIALDSAREDMGDANVLDSRPWEAALGSRIARETKRPSASRQARFEELVGRVREYFATVRATPVRPGGIGFLDSYPARKMISEVMLAAEDVLGPERGRRAGFDLWMEAQALGSMSRALRAPACSLEAARSELVPADGGILVYLPSIEESHVLVVDGERLVRATLPGIDTFHEDLREYQRLLMTPPAGLDPRDRDHREARVANLGARLADILIPLKVRECIQDWSALTVVGTNLLDDLAFESLPVAGTPLGQRWAVGRWDSLSTALALTRRSRSAERSPKTDLAVLAAPEPDLAHSERWPNVASLPLEASALDALEQPYGQRVERRVAGQATETSARALASEARVLQVVAHGVFDEERERGACLVLAPDRSDDGLVTCDEAQAWPATSVIVLTACGAAFGPPRMGDDGVAHLGGAFLAAGAGCVVLSRQEVAGNATLRLMNIFHRELRGANCSPAEALRRARAELARDPRWSDPFYTSLVFATGNTHDAVF